MALSASRERIANHLARGFTANPSPVLLSLLLASLLLLFALDPIAAAVGLIIPLEVFSLAWLGASVLYSGLGWKAALPPLLLALSLWGTSTVTGQSPLLAAYIFLCVATMPSVFLVGPVLVDVSNAWKRRFSLIVLILGTIALVQAVLSGDPDSGHATLTSGLGANALGFFLVWPTVLWFCRPGPIRYIGKLSVTSLAMVSAIFIDAKLALATSLILALALFLSAVTSGQLRNSGKASLTPLVLAGLSTFLAFAGVGTASGAPSSVVPPILTSVLAETSAAASNSQRQPEQLTQQTQRGVVDAAPDATVSEHEEAVELVSTRAFGSGLGSHSSRLATQLAQGQIPTWVHHGFSPQPNSPAQEWIAFVESDPPNNQIGTLQRGMSSIIAIREEAGIVGAVILSIWFVVALLRLRQSLGTGVVLGLAGATAVASSLSNFLEFFEIAIAVALSIALVPKRISEEAERVSP